MNYRHAFHAGNFADVVKHVTLFCLLEHLNRKPKPWCYVETHAGRGHYRLDGAEARRGAEWPDGIGRLVDRRDLPGGIGRYLAQVSALTGNQAGLRCYPGSPLLARALMRAADRAILAELQPDEARALKKVFRGDARVAVHETDGYQALKAFLPPTPRRGLVLVDPPYESSSELERLGQALTQAARRWPTGIFALWYPIKDRRELAPLMRGLVAADDAPVLVAELTVAPADNPAHMNGTGMAILRPPWRLEETLRELYPVLGRLLRRERPAATSIRRLDAGSVRATAARPQRA